VTTHKALAETLEAERPGPHRWSARSAARNLTRRQLARVVEIEPAANPGVHGVACGQPRMSKGTRQQRIDVFAPAAQHPALAI